MSDVGRASCRRASRLLAGTAVLAAALLVGCGRDAPVEVSASAAPPMPVAGPAEPTTSFQGAVAALDTAAGSLVVDVRIIWTPVIKAGEGEDRVVLVDHGTRWDPAPLGLGDLRVGEEVQVDAVDRADGTWQAVQIQLLDID